MGAFIGYARQEGAALVDKLPHPVIDQQTVRTVFINEEHVRRAIAVIIRKGSADDAGPQRRQEQRRGVLELPRAIVQEKLGLARQGFAICIRHISSREKKIDVAILIDIDQIHSLHSGTHLRERPLRLRVKVSLTVVEQQFSIRSIGKLSYQNHVGSSIAIQIAHRHESHPVLFLPNPAGPFV